MGLDTVNYTCCYYKPESRHSRNWQYTRVDSWVDFQCNSGGRNRQKLHSSHYTHCTVHKDWDNMDFVEAVFSLEKPIRLRIKLPINHARFFDSELVTY